MAGVRAGISGQVNNNIVTDGLVFYIDPAYKISYPRSGTTTTDIINNLSGTFQNGTIFSTDGVGSFYYGGGDEYVSLSTDLLTHISNVETLTICQWAKPAASNDFMTLGHVDTHPYARQNYGTWNSGNIIYNIGTTGNTTGCAIYKAYTNWGNWSYWCCTYDKNQGSFADRLKGYIDGVNPGGWTEYGNSGYNTGTITNFDLGYVGQYGAYSNGYQGPVQIYNRVLSAAEIKQNYQAQKERFGL